MLINVYLTCRVQSHMRQTTLRDMHRKTICRRPNSLLCSAVWHTDDSVTR